MESITWEVGGVKIIQLIEIEGGAVIQEAIPEATRENIVKIPWLVPHFADSEGNLKALVQAFIVDTGKTRIIIDTCLGNEKKRTDVPEWGSLQTDFLERLEDCGYPRNDIDIVLCTHLHFDHVGWNTMLFDGEWVATFPKARYLFAKDEFDYWKAKPEEEIEDDRAGFSDSVVPVGTAGLAD